jgi:hypothetical protein
MLRFGSSSFAIAAILVTAPIGCSDQGPSGEAPELQQLTRLASPDSAGGGDPVNPTPSGPGKFQGVVAGEGIRQSERSASSLGPDLPDVHVTVYPVIGSPSSANPEVGPAIVRRVTNAYGEFETPEIPGGKYVVTFVPPDGSSYQGVYWVATAHPNDVPVFWRVMLPRK